MSDTLAGFSDIWFDQDAITFVTGANAGRTIEVKSWAQVSDPTCGRRPAPR